MLKSTFECRFSKCSKIWIDRLGYALTLCRCQRNFKWILKRGFRVKMYSNEFKIFDRVGKFQRFVSTRFRFQSKYQCYSSLVVLQVKGPFVFLQNYNWARVSVDTLLGIVHRFISLTKFEFTPNRDYFSPSESSYDAKYSLNKRISPTTTLHAWGTNH